MALQESALLHIKNALSWYVTMRFVSSHKCASLDHKKAHC